MTPAEIPPELVEMLDRAAGRVHNPDGRVLRTLAEILTRFEQILAESKTTPPGR